jgi:hypothetical protein
MGWGPQDIVRDIVQRGAENAGGKFMEDKSNKGMIPIRGEMLVLYLLHKLIKHIGKDNQKALNYIGVWHAAKKKGFIKIEAPQKLKDAVRGIVEETGAKFSKEGNMEVNGKEYDCNRMLAETMRESLGFVNLVSFKAEADSKYPGIVGIIEKGYDIGKEGSISSMLDDIASGLESRGLIKEAFEIDKIADEIDGGFWN